MPSGAYFFGGIALKNPFKDLNRFELLLWIVSVLTVTVTFFAFGQTDYLTLTASLIGVTALIFVAKGYVIGQVLTIVFAVFYGIISFKQRYYGEMITYLGMTAPIAAVAAINWLRNPYKGTKEVAIAKMSNLQKRTMILLSVGVTAGFYFILKALGNASLFFSTVSVTTSFLASYLTACRSPYYALAYAANDVVLIILWIIASGNDTGCVPMIACFTAFFANDVYGFVNWQSMKKRQKD